MKTPCAWGLSLLFTEKRYECWPWERTVIRQPHTSARHLSQHAGGFGLALGSRPAPTAGTWGQPVEQGRSPRCPPPARLQALQGLSGCQGMECREGDASSFPPRPTPRGNAPVMDAAPGGCRAPSGPALGTPRRSSAPGRIQSAR